MTKDKTKTTNTRLSRFNIVKLRRKDLEALKASGQKTRIGVVGMLVVEDDVSPELAMDTIESAKVYGAILAPSEVRNVIISKNPA